MHHLNDGTFWTYGYYAFSFVFFLESITKLLTATSPAMELLRHKPSRGA
jgi:hypothetical protein